MRCSIRVWSPRLSGTVDGTGFDVDYACVYPRCVLPRQKERQRRERCDAVGRV